MKDEPFSVALITYTTSLPWPGALIPRPINVLKAYDNTDNKYNYVSHMQFYSHPSVLYHKVLRPLKKFCFSTTI